MEYVPFEPGIEVNGQTVYAIVDGFRGFTLMASEYLLKAGVGVPGPDKMVKIDPEAWYPQAAWLEAFKNIGGTVGDAVLFQIGLAIPRNAKFPPWVNDVHTAVKSIDVAYHMNHRKDGKELFDPATGELREGIGHYGYTRTGDRGITAVCPNPYPCAFDRGIITAMAQRFERRAVVKHVESQPCRKRGAMSCTYEVSWS